MKRLLADTSALIALRDGGDANHESAAAWLKASIEEGSLRLVVTNYILAEVHAFFCRTPSAALAYVERIRADKTFQVVHATGADENEAWAILKRSQDKTYSFVDAVSFSVMRRMSIASALAFDAHFRQYGRFSVLP